LRGLGFHAFFFSLFFFFVSGTSFCFFQYSLFVQVPGEFGLSIPDPPASTKTDSGVEQSFYLPSAAFAALSLRSDLFAGSSPTPPPLDAIAREAMSFFFLLWLLLLFFYRSTCVIPSRSFSRFFSQGSPPPELALLRPDTRGRSFFFHFFLPPSCGPPGSLFRSPVIGSFSRLP